MNAKPPPDLKDLKEAINDVEKIQLDTTLCEKNKKFEKPLTIVCICK